jgi:hypothetical protein
MSFNNCSKVYFNCCYKCTQRKVGCHSRCEEYIAATNKMKSDKHEYESAKLKEMAATKVSQQGYDRMRKRRSSNHTFDK